MAKTRKQYRHSQKGGFWDSLNNWWANTSQKTKEIASNAGKSITNWSDNVANKASELSHKAGEVLNKDVSIHATTNNAQAPAVYEPVYQPTSTTPQPMVIGGKKKSQKRRRLYKKSKSHGKKRTSKK